MASCEADPDSAQRRRTIVNPARWPMNRIAPVYATRKSNDSLFYVQDRYRQNGRSCPDRNRDNLLTAGPLVSCNNHRSLARFTFHYHWHRADSVRSFGEVGLRADASTTGTDQPAAPAAATAFCDADESTAGFSSVHADPAVSGGAPASGRTLLSFLRNGECARRRVLPKVRETLATSSMSSASITASLASALGSESLFFDFTCNDQYTRATILGSNTARLQDPRLERRSC